MAEAIRARARRRLTVLLALACSASLAQAAPAPPSAAPAPAPVAAEAEAPPSLLLLGSLTPEAAQAMLEAPRAALRGAAGLEGRFHQVHSLAGIRTPLRSGGRFLVAPELGVWWSLETPFANTTVLGPAGLIAPPGAAAPELGPGLPLVAATLTQLFTLDVAALAERFVLHGGAEGGRWRLELVPREESLRRMLARLSIEGTVLAERVSLELAGGDHTLISFEQVEVLPALDAARRARFTPGGAH